MPLLVRLFETNFPVFLGVSKPTAGVGKTADSTVSEVDSGMIFLCVSENLYERSLSVAPFSL